MASWYTREHGIQRKVWSRIRLKVLERDNRQCGALWAGMDDALRWITQRHCTWADLNMTWITFKPFAGILAISRKRNRITSC